MRAVSPDRIICPTPDYEPTPHIHFPPSILYFPNSPVVHSLNDFYLESHLYTGEVFFVTPIEEPFAFCYFFFLFRLYQHLFHVFSVFLMATAASEQTGARILRPSEPSGH